MELSIDTSTRFASVAISRRGETVAELTWRSERNHSVELVPAIRELTARAGIEIRGLEAIFIARGPGGFSALRVGMSTAKAMAASLAIPLVAVGTLDLEVAPYLGLGYPVCGVIGAGRTRVYVGGYGIGEEPKYDVVSTEEFLSTVQPDHLYCGEGVHELASELRQRLGDGLLVADVPPPTRRAGAMAAMAYHKLQAGDVEDA
ncbi:MAG: tRNA (adenosine(37)-N6)-threonylcarbamoyltransferase complex dimerization subunit type 1 TsaB, partial [Chloroflexi bacterium]|nr:tRNA (adenosine(37)-N6)-threonylcarbamoyltransferase complex dimerization subunit type 1 TsaB [Chloroflexota bacterium]